MRAAIFIAPGSIEIGVRPDPRVEITGSDFVIDGGVTAAYFYGDLQPSAPTTQTGTT